MREKVKGDDEILTRDGVAWAAVGRLSLRFTAGLMSVKPRRRPDDGGAMVACTRPGCISDMGGLMGDEAPGVLGTRAGDEGIGLAALGAFGTMGPLGTSGKVMWAMVAGLSSCSATEDKAGASVACLGACNSSDAGQRARDGGIDATAVDGWFVYFGAALYMHVPW